MNSFQCSKIPSRLLSISLFTCIFFLLLNIPNSSGKIVQQSYSGKRFEKQDHTIYLTKFSIDIGRGTFQGTIRFSRPPLSPSQQSTIVTLGVISDAQFDNYYAATTCTEKQSYLEIAQQVSIPNDTSNSQQIEFNLLTNHRRRTYFFVLHECDKQLSARIPSALDFEVNFEIMNVDNSHFPSEEEGFLVPLFLMTIACIVGLTFNISKILRQYRKQEEFDWPFMLCNLSIILQTISLFLEWAHMLIYSYNGTGSLILSLFSQISGISSQFTVACIFILLSSGWTINYTQIDDIDVYIPLAVLLGVVHVMIVGLNKLTDDQSYKHHQYGGFIGWILVLMRLGMFVGFISNIRKTKANARQKVQTFLIRFTIFGSLYFLAFPILVLISKFIAGYVQHRFITVGTLLMQSITISIMSIILTSKTSDYYHAAIKSSSELPTGKHL